MSWSRSRATRPSRSSAWSSAITTRMAAPPRIGRPAAGRAVDVEACRRAPRRGGAGRPGRCRAGSAPPGPSSATSTTQRARRSRRARTRRRRPRRVLGRVGQRLGDDEVGGGLDDRRRAGASSSRVDRRPASPSARPSASTAAARPRSASTGGAMPRARSRSSAIACARLARGRARTSAAASGRSVEPLLGAAELHAQRDEPGLRAVVQVALDPAQLGRLHVERAAPGARQLVDPRRQPGSRASRAARRRDATRACTPTGSRSRAHSPAATRPEPPPPESQSPARRMQSAPPMPPLSISPRACEPGCTRQVSRIAWMRPGSRGRANTDAGPEGAAAGHAPQDRRRRRR